MSDEILRYGASLLGAGLVSGFAGGLFGIGGGLLRVPIFLYLFPAFGVGQALTMHLAAGTSLALAVPTSISAALAQRRAGNVEAAFLRVWLPALGAGVVIGLAASRFVPGPTLRAIFAGVVLLAALQLLFTGRAPMLRRQLTRLGRAVAAVLIGALSVLLGLSGGIFVTPTLTAFGYPVHRAFAVSSVGGILISAVGVAGYVANGWSVAGLPAHSLGYVDGIAFLVMAPAVMATASLGVRAANRLDPLVLKRVFGAFLVGVSLDMMYDAWQAS